MNNVKWAAWGVVDIEALERMQRRNYIKKVRAELAKHGATLDCGGDKVSPFYLVHIRDDLDYHARGDGAFREVMQNALETLSPGEVQQIPDTAAG